MLKKERITLEKEKEQFKELKVVFRVEMETGKKEFQGGIEKLKLSEEKFKAEVSEKNKTFFEREWTLRKSEDKLLKLAEQNSEEESRIGRANLSHY